MTRSGMGIASVLLVMLLGAFDLAYATARVGEKMDVFELQSTDGPFYGTKNAKGKISVLFFVGYS